jgi:hypothetical protein
LDIIQIGNIHGHGKSADSRRLIRDAQIAQYWGR